MTGNRAAVLFAAATLLAPFLVATGIAAAATASGALTAASDTSGVAASCVTSGAPGGPAVAGLDPAQLANARIIDSVAVSMGLPPQAAIIAIATAMQESTLRNLPYGDRDSLGLFQQRPSQGWGTPAQIMNPVYAATSFYQALEQVPGWQQLPLTVAAQDVQHSADGGAYENWHQLAAALVSKLAGSSSAQCISDDGRGVPATGKVQLPAGYNIPLGTPALVVVAIDYALGQLGKPYLWGATGPDAFDCSGLVMMAYRAAGIDLPRTTYQQVLIGTPVDNIDDLKAGDLLFTAGSDGTVSHPGHVGMYLGHSLVIDAPQTGEEIQITALSEYWETSTVAVRRIVDS